MSSDSYPAGALDDPRAPFNKPDIRSEVEDVWTFHGELVVDHSNGCDTIDVTLLPGFDHSIEDQTVWDVEISLAEGTVTITFPCGAEHEASFDDIEEILNQ